MGFISTTSDILQLVTFYHGHSVEEIRDYLGHKLIETTLIYARVKRENLKKLGESLDTTWALTAIRKIDAL